VIQLGILLLIATPIAHVLFSTFTSTSCVVTAAKDIFPGSDVDCTDDRDIQVNGGEIRVHDGRFVLRGRSLTLNNGGKLVADCPQSSTRSDTGSSTPSASSPTRAAR
jgi:hypothetical protein